MAKKKIPDEVQAQVNAIVEQFNREELRGSHCFYIARYTGNYLYLVRQAQGNSINKA